MTATENIELPRGLQNPLNIFAEHPKGLPTLFFTEMWERFSYYGMRALLALYMVALPSEGGLGFSGEVAGGIYGTYTMLVYLTAIPGGYIADNFLGRKFSILLGGIIIAAGHFTLAFKSMPTFYTGLGLIIIGTGFLKPNISTLLGTLYGENDHRRDAGFSIYYMGINIGATLAPIVCGFLAQSDEFKHFLTSNHLDPNSSWHWGFAAAGVGMLLGLANFLWTGKTLAGYGGRPEPKQKTTTVQKVEIVEQAAAELSGVAELAGVPDIAKVGQSSAADQTLQSQKAPPMTKEEWYRLAAIALLFLFNIMFWSVYEQGGTSLNFFADKMTDCRIFGWRFPSTWLQSFQAVFVIILAPVFSWLWLKLGDKEPSSPAKFAWGVFLLGLGIALMAPASLLAVHGKVSPMWLICCYLLQVCGELCLSPVGLSTVTKLAPIRILSMTMGFWFCSNAIANKIAGSIGGHFNSNDPGGLVYLFGGMGAAALLATLILLALKPSIRKLMSGVH